MKLVKFGKIYINIDRIDGVGKKYEDDKNTYVFVGGNSTPFIIDDIEENVIKKIQKAQKEGDYL